MPHMFTAKRDDGIAEHRIIVDLAIAAEFGDVLTYEIMAEALGRDARDRSSLQQVARRAGTELRRRHKRSLEAVANRGYRVLDPAEHLLQARRHQDKSRRQMRTSVEVLVATDLERLPSPQREATIAMTAVARHMVQALDHMERRQRKTDALLAEATVRLDQHEEALRTAGLLRDPIVVDADSTELGPKD